MNLGVIIMSKAMKYFVHIPNSSLSHFKLIPELNLSSPSCVSKDSSMNTTIEGNNKSTKSNSFCKL